jgi:hypothetical protein
MLPHRVRVQLAGADFPVASFEIPVDVNITSVADVVATASTEVARQIEDHNKTHKAEIQTPLRLYANTEVCFKPRPPKARRSFKTAQGFHIEDVGGGVTLLVADNPRINEMCQTLAAVGVAHGGTLYVADAARVEALLATRTRVLDAGAELQ